jgi:hypothetical protein
MFSFAKACIEKLSGVRRRMQRCGCQNVLLKATNCSHPSWYYSKSNTKMKLAIFQTFETRNKMFKPKWKTQTMNTLLHRCLFILTISTKHTAKKTRREYDASLEVGRSGTTLGKFVVFYSPSRETPKVSYIKSHQLQPTPLLVNSSLNPVILVNAANRYKLYKFQPKTTALK